MKNTINLKVTISSIVANILATVKPSPTLVISITIKQVKPADTAAMLPKALSRLLPNDNFIKSRISYFLSNWIICLKAIYQPYNLMNFIPSIIYVHVFILLSLNTLIFWVIFPFSFPTNIWKGRIIKITPNGKIPGQPNLVIKIAIIPTNPNGVPSAAKNIGLLISIVLKSFDKRFIILPSYWVLAVYWDIFESFA